MADEVGRDLPSFLTSVLDKTEYIWRNDVGKGTVEAYAEVIDQSIRMLRSIRDSLSWYWNKLGEELDQLAAAFADEGCC